MNDLWLHPRDCPVAGSMHPSDCAPAQSSLPQPESYAWGRGGGGGVVAGKGQVETTRALYPQALRDAEFANVLGPTLLQQLWLLWQPPELAQTLSPGLDVSGFGLGVPGAS